jgi:ribonuclease III
MNKKDFSEITKNTGYRFQNSALLEESMRHSSFVNEQADKSLADNERLEFLGDAVLNLAISHLLMQHYPSNNEGPLSRMRSNLVNESKLADMARTLNLGRFIQLGKGELNSNGFEKQSILADTFEAFIAAVYLDGGYRKAFEMVQKLFETQLQPRNGLSMGTDYKSRLQEICQLKQIQTPVYEMSREFGPDHDKTFVIKLTVDHRVTEGVGKNKKAAEQDAAQKAFKIISESGQK